MYVLTLFFDQKCTYGSQIALRRVSTTFRISIGGPYVRHHLDSGHERAMSVSIRPDGTEAGGGASTTPSDASADFPIRFPRPHARRLLWGGATASSQYEGAYAEGGKGLDTQDCRPYLPRTSNATTSTRLLGRNAIERASRVSGCAMRASSTLSAPHRMDTTILMKTSPCSKSSASTSTVSRSAGRACSPPVTKLSPMPLGSPTTTACSKRCTRPA